MGVSESLERMGLRPHFARVSNPCRGGRPRPRPLFAPVKHLYERESPIYQCFGLAVGFDNVIHPDTLGIGPSYTDLVPDFGPRGIEPRVGRGLSVNFVR